MEPSAFSLGLALWLSTSLTSLVTTPYNPSNSTSQIPWFKLQPEVRPELKFKSDAFSAVVRSRLYYFGSIAEVSGATQSNWTPSTTNTKVYFNDAYGEWRATDTVMFTYGLQNYQWGPAEIASPSNQFFHETAQNRDLLYVVNGRHLFRLNVTPTDTLSIVGMVELTGNADAAFVAEQAFLPKFGLKTELNWNGGADSAGIVVGGTQNRGWFGPYATLEIADGLAMFADTSIQLGADTWLPNGTTMDQPLKNSAAPFLISAFGLRYAFTSGEDLRLEYLYQGTGYTAEQRETLTGMLTSSNPLVLANLTTTATRAASPGLDFPGRSYLYTSLRVPTLFKVKDLTGFLRYLISTTDTSGLLFGSLDYAVSEHGNLMVSVGATHGQATTELRGLTSVSGLLAYRHAW